MSQKSYDKSPTLYLIPTPIGNMEDITLRAINILKEVEVVFCEDTRVTGQLLNNLNIKKKLISNFEHNEAKNKEKLLEYLNSGCNVGLVSDRGTPIISDPGYNLSKVAIDSGFNVVSLPGPTALIPALTSSGLNPMPFCFYGFLNSKSSKRKISISREITKKYEEIYRGEVSELIKENNNYKGELVIVIEGSNEDYEYKNLSVIEHVNFYIKDGMKPMDAIKLVAKERNLKKSEVYDVYHNLEKK